MIGLESLILLAARSLRSRLENSFSADTSVDPSNFMPALPSAGHCAAVSVLALRTFESMEFEGEPMRAEFVSAMIPGVGSHWFVRVHAGGESFDVDLTADQLGLEPVEIAPAGELHAGTRVRSFDECNSATLFRAELLLERSVEATRAPSLTTLGSE